MPNFDSNDPREFGASLAFRAFVPFVYQGRLFPQGVHPACVGVFQRALARLQAAGLELPPSSMGLAGGFWGQEDRMTKSGDAISFHQFGYAIDVAAPWNPWRVKNPPASPYRLPDNTSALLEPLGLLWGGSPRWGDNCDRMHLENHNTPAELGAYPPLHSPGPPHVPVTPGVPAFPLPFGYYYGPYSGPAQSISGQGIHDGPYRAGLALAQGKLRVTADGLYGPHTAAAATSWQAAHHLVADGLIGPLTWRSLFG